VNRLQKTLEGANIKLASVVSDVTGLSARQILASLVSGQTDRAQLADLAKGRLREKLPQLQEALWGSFGAHQRFLVGQQLAHLEDLETSLSAVSTEIERRLATPPDEPEPRQREEAPPEKAQPESGNEATLTAAQEAMARLMTIPGVGRRTAQLLVSEVGLEMERFPTHRHLGAWAGMAPGNHESAGKRKSGKTRKGSRWLRAGLVEAAQAAGRTKGTYLGAQYKRLVGRLGKRRGAVAVGHTMLVIAYHLLKERSEYEELGANYFDERDRRSVEQRAVKRLEALGYQVTLTAKSAAA
jgi:transposase